MDLGGRYKHVAEYFSVPVIIIQIQYVLLSCQMIQACTTKIKGVETQKILGTTKPEIGNRKKAKQ